MIFKSNEGTQKSMSGLFQDRRIRLILATLGAALGIAIYLGARLQSHSSGDVFDLSLLTKKENLGREMLAALDHLDEDGLSRGSAVLICTRGKVRFRFYTGDAPKTVRRIAELIASGFYNGLTFHRVVPGFVAQGGDPTGTGIGGSGVKLPPEFNRRLHVLGVIAMARSSDLESADSQFYFSLGTHPHLDHQYTVFGKVVEGLEVLDQIQVGDRINQMVLELR
jgi:peptidylprolyl isomerase/peptidyl-prolyl cis-trans isomerase B (cyclophilin B)